MANDGLYPLLACTLLLHTAVLLGIHFGWLLHVSPTTNPLIVVVSMENQMDAWSGGNYIHLFVPVGPCQCCSDPSIAVVFHEISNDA